MNIQQKTICLIVTALCFSCGKKEKATAPDTELPPPTKHAAYCFREVTTNAGVTDSLSIHLIINGDSLSGTWNWVPAEKDKMVGTLQGTVHDNEVTAIYSYTAEGQTAKEEKLFKIDGDTLRIKQGELEEHDGIWKLKNSQAVGYTETVTRVDCDVK